MILKASQRSGGQNLAAHLMRTDENEHVELHDLQGFAGCDLFEAFEEAHAISRATRCKMYLFSLSLNPPETAIVPDIAFERAIQEIEKKLGLEGLPRAIVFHEKEGRRHAHCVWSRIDPETLKARPLPFFKFKLRDLSRELYFEHGWKLPPGLMNSKARSLQTFTLAEWQQAKRQGADPREIKQVLQECWAASDGTKALRRSLEERGFRLARGDRRSFVAVDFRGEVFSLPRWLGVATKRVREKLGPEENFPTVSEAVKDFAEQITPMLQRHLDEIGRERARGAAAAAHAKSQIVARHRLARKQQDQTQQSRHEAEDRKRSARLPGGVRGLWNWLMGRSGRIRSENEADRRRCDQRDVAERDDLRIQQRQERQALQQRVRAVRDRSRSQVLELRRDIVRFQSSAELAPRRVERRFDGPEFG